tara:strand:+ start:139 stop:372 length:234 start_codon:yes stop_codon:yes gene_type:complete
MLDKLIKMGYNVSMKKIKKNDLVKLVRFEPNAVGRVITFLADGQVIVKWEDGITSEHEIKELRLIRLEEFSTSWLSF